MKFIKLTPAEEHHSSVYVNANHISRIEYNPGGACSLVYFDVQRDTQDLYSTQMYFIGVAEHPEEIIKRIKESEEI